jgi:hypothetical protein
MSTVRSHGSLHGPTKSWWRQPASRLSSHPASGDQQPESTETNPSWPQRASTARSTRRRISGCATSPSPLVLKQLLIGALLASQTVLVAAAEPTPLQAWLKSRRMAVAKNWAQSETWDDICNAMRIDNRDCGLGTCIMGACTCDVGWSGPLCDDVDECYQWSPCQNGGSCFQSADVVAGHRVLGTNKFVCACSAGFDGRRCQCRECGPHGVCQDDGTCSCRYGWSGVGCLLAPDPCMWPVRVHCGAHGKCISSHPQSSHCQCTGGFSGVACDQSPDACLHPAIVVCGMHGSCVDGACICTDGYRGPRCMVAPPPKKPAYDGSAIKARLRRGNFVILSPNSCLYGESL